jgi:hypothetical protein
MRPNGVVLGRILEQPMGKVTVAIEPGLNSILGVITKNFPLG